MRLRLIWKSMRKRSGVAGNFCDEIASQQEYYRKQFAIVNHTRTRESPLKWLLSNQMNAGCYN